MALVILNSEQQASTDMNGKAVFKKNTDTRKIKVYSHYFSPNILEYKVLNIKSNQFLIYAYTTLGPEIYFENVKVRRKGSKLIMVGNPLSGGKLNRLVLKLFSETQKQK